MDIRPAPSDAPHAGFSPVRACCVCTGAALRPAHTAVFQLSAYDRQDPGLTRYTGAMVEIVRCVACGFGQPAALPGLTSYLGRMYDQRWSADWMETEYGYKPHLLAFAWSPA